MDNVFIKREIQKVKIGCQNAISTSESVLLFRVSQYREAVRMLKAHGKPFAEEEEIIRDLEDAIEALRKFSKEVKDIKIDIGGNKNV